jgi:UDP-N-acetylmuramoylalanine--D-glutamate ligase
MELVLATSPIYPWVGIYGHQRQNYHHCPNCRYFSISWIQCPRLRNIGYAACEVALRTRNGDQNRKSKNPKSKSTYWVIAEISSYQIESSQNLAPANWCLDDLYTRSPQPS